MTIGQFISALESINKVRDELRPKTNEEIVALMGESVARQQKKQRELKKKRRKHE